MFTADYFGQRETKLEKIDDIIENIGSQTRIHDNSTGIFTRILNGDKELFTLCEAGNSPKGFLGESYKFAYQFSSGIAFKKLTRKIKETINGMSLSRKEVNDLIDNGLLNMLLRKNPELAETEGFSLVLNMERIDRQFEIGHIPYTDISDKIAEILGQNSISDEDKLALETLKKLYENDMFKRVRQAQYEKYGKTEPKLHSAQEISEDLEKIGRKGSKDSALQQILSAEIYITEDKGKEGK